MHGLGRKQAHRRSPKLQLAGLAGWDHFVGTMTHAAKVLQTGWSIGACRRRRPRTKGTTRSSMVNYCYFIQHSPLVLLLYCTVTLRTCNRSRALRKAPREGPVREDSKGQSSHIIGRLEQARSGTEIEAATKWNMNPLGLHQTRQLDKFVLVIVDILVHIGDKRAHPIEAEPRHADRIWNSPHNANVHLCATLASAS